MIGDAAQINRTVLAFPTVQLLGNSCRTIFVDGFLKLVELIDVYVRISGSGRGCCLLSIVQSRGQILTGVQIVGTHGTEHALAIIDPVGQISLCHGNVTGVFGTFHRSLGAENVLNFVPNSRVAAVIFSSLA